MSESTGSSNKRQQKEDNVRSAELDFMQDLEMVLKETAADPENTNTPIAKSRVVLN